MCCPLRRLLSGSDARFQAGSRSSAEIASALVCCRGLVRASGAADASAASQSGTPMITKNAQIVYVAPRLAALAYGACAMGWAKKQ